MRVITWECSGGNPAHVFKTAYGTDIKPCTIKDSNGLPCGLPAINRLLTWKCDLPGCEVTAEQSPANWYDFSSRIAQWNERGGLRVIDPLRVYLTKDDPPYEVPQTGLIYNVQFCTLEHAKAWFAEFILNDFVMRDRGDLL